MATGESKRKTECEGRSNCLKMNTWHVHIEGQVQGVGFRPFIFVLAQEYGLKGWVNNTFDGVHVVFNADKKVAVEFTDKVKNRAPFCKVYISLHKQIFNNVISIELLDCKYLFSLSL